MSLQARRELLFRIEGRYQRAGKKEKITFTRSRVYKKNDQAHVEQKR